MPANDKTPKTMDVSSPGTVAPDESARPVIVTHRPRVQDPTLVASDKQVDEQELGVGKAVNKSDPVSGSRSKRVIEPIKESSDKDSEGEKKSEPAQASSETDDAVEEAVIDAVVGQADINSGKTDEKLDKQVKAEQENIQKLIAEKTYFLPVGQAAQQRNRRATILLIMMLVMGLGGYAALDMQLISNTLPLPFHLRKQKPEASAPPVVVAVTPKPAATTKKYTSKLDSLTFEYPLNWKINSSSLVGSPEYLLIQPTTPADKLKSFQVQFNRLSPASGPGPVLNRTATKIEYFDVQVNTAAKLYLRQVVYEETIKDIKSYGVALSVTDKKGTEKPGDIIADFDTPFLAADGKTKLVFTGLVAIYEAGASGAKTQAAVESYIATNKDFIDAKKTLLTLKLK